MINNSPPLQSLKHAITTGSLAGVGAGVMQIIENSNMTNIISPMLGQTVGSGVNAFAVFRIYDGVKSRVYSILESTKIDEGTKHNISKWSGSTIGGIEIFIITYLTQNISGGDAALKLGLLYGIGNIIFLPTLYEKYLKKINKV